MAFRVNTDLKNYIVNQGVIKVLAGTMGTGGTASIWFYTGSQPATADMGTSGTLLATIIAVGWGGATGGAACTTGATAGTAMLCTTSSSAGIIGTATATGTAGWARMQTVGTNFTGSAATFRIDGDVGTSSACVFVVNNPAFVSGGLITLQSAPIYMS